MLIIKTLKDYFDITNAWSHGAPDINDKDFDFLTHLEYDNELHDNYDRCLEYICSHLEFIEIAPNPDYGITCDICGFIEAHRTAFDKFMNEENNENYTPKYYYDLDGSIYTPNDDEYYDLYLATFDSLLAGNYTDDDYAKLLKYMKGEE